MRSRPNFSSAWYVPSGSCEVTRWPPRTALIFASSCSRGTTSSASSRCSVDDVVVLACFFASSKALSSTFENAAETFGCCCAPWMRGFAASVASASRAERVGIGHELARQLLVEQREQQMLGIELGVARCGAQAPAQPRRPPGS